MEPTLQVQGLNPTEPAVPQNPIAPSGVAVSSAQAPQANLVPIPDTSAPVNAPAPVTEQAKSIPPLPEKPKRNLKALAFILIGIFVLGAGAYFIYRAPSEELTGMIAFDKIAKVEKEFKEEEPQAPATPQVPAPEAPKGPKIVLPEVNIDVGRELPPQGTPGAGFPPPPAPEAPKGGAQDINLDFAHDLAKPDFGAATDALRGAPEAPKGGGDKKMDVGEADRLLVALDNAKEPQKQPEPIKQPEQPGEKEREMPKIERDEIVRVGQPDDAAKEKAAEEARAKIDAAKKAKEEADAAKAKAEQEAKIKEEETRAKIEAAKKAKEEADAAKAKAEQDAKSKAEAEAFKKMIEEQAQKRKAEEDLKKTEEEKKKTLAEEEAARKKVEADAKKKAAEEKRKAEEAELLAIILAEEEEEEPVVPKAPASGAPSSSGMDQQLDVLKQQLAAALRNQSDVNAYQVGVLQAEIVALNKQIEGVKASGGVTVVVPQAGGATGTACADPSFTYDPVRKVCIPPTAVTVIPESEKAKEISIVTKKDKKLAMLDTASAGTEGETEASSVAAAAAKAKAAASAKAAGAPGASAKTGAAKATGVKSAGTASGAAGAAKKLHGAAIQGETGPEILLYPLLIASANGLYYAFKKRRKSVK